MFIESLQFSFSIIGPICLLLFLGWFLKKTNTINDAFIDVGSKLVFKITLPALLFLSIIKNNRDIDIDFSLIFYSLAANFVFFTLSVLGTRYWVKNKNEHGVVIQGAFRSNIAIIGLAYVANVYGDSGFAIAAVYVAFHTMLYNILSVIILTPKQEGISVDMFLGVFKSLMKNPLIIGITSGVIFFLFAIPVPELVIHTGQYFSNMTLPLALLCTGGSLNMQALKDNSFNCRFSSMLKIIIAPLLITTGAYLYGFRDMQLGLIFFMSASPTAAASYVMARSMGHNSDLAANIIAMTTIGSLITSSLGVSFLYWLGLI